MTANLLIERNERLAGIWRKALDVPVVNPDDDFFALGGNSIIALMLLAQVRDTFDVEIPVSTLANASTFSAFADVIALALDAREKGG